MQNAVLRKRKHLIFAALAASATVIVASNSVLSDPIMNYYDRITYALCVRAYSKPFSSKDWLSHPSTSQVWNVRMRMYQDLIDKRALLGKTRAGVRAILGQEYDNYNGSMLYLLGSEPEMIHVDKYNKFLVIAFQDDRVSSVSASLDW